MLHPGRAPQPHRHHRHHRPRGGQRLPRSLPVQVAGSPGALAGCPRLSAPGAAAAGAGLGGGGRSARGGCGKVASPPAGNFPREGGKLVCLRISLFSALFRAFGEGGRETTAAGERVVAERRRELPGLAVPPAGSGTPGPLSYHRSWAFVFPAFRFRKCQGQRARARAPAIGGVSSAPARPSCPERRGRLPGPGHPCPRRSYPVLPCPGVRAAEELRVEPLAGHGRPQGRRLRSAVLGCRDHLGSTFPSTNATSAFRFPPS